MSAYPRVLMVGPGPKVRGGISAVILTYRRNEIWPSKQLEWLSTYDDRGWPAKVVSGVSALALALVAIPRNDVIHIHAAWKTSFCRKSGFFALARCFGKKTVLHLHAPDFSGFRKGFVGALSRRVFSQADAVVVLSETWAHSVRTLVPDANVKVIPNPCEVPAERPSGLATREPVIVFSGKLESRKGFLDLIRAMPAVIESVPNARLVMAGHGEIEAARDLAGFLGIANHVECLGWVTGEKKKEVLSKARVFCLPSYGEGLPMAMLEAMSHSIPVVVTPVGGIPDVVKDGSNGVLVEPGNISGISTAITSLLLNTASAQRMADAARESVASEFGPDHMRYCLRQLYGDLMGTPLDDAANPIERSGTPVSSAL